MIYDAAQILIAVCETLLVVYGIVESKLFTRVRLAFEMMLIYDSEKHGGGASLFSGFLHCPFCVGFWVALAIGLLHGARLETMFVVPACYVTLLLFKRDLIRSNYEFEESRARHLAGEYRLAKRREQEQEDPDEPS
jgi:hypothetical protein